MRIAFRTDSSQQIGTGHLMRCLTLADELARRGHETLFVCRDLAGNLAPLVSERGHVLISLPAPAASDDLTPEPGEVLAHAAWLVVSQAQDAEETAEALKRTSTPFDWLVVDHYALDARWETRLRPQCRRILVIDDLADRRHDCDLLLDQNLHRDMETRYQGLVPKHCASLLGPKLALLRPEFGVARRAMRPRSGEVNRVLVFFGGVDASNETFKTLEALDLIANPRIAVDVVIGRTNPHREMLEAYCAQRPQIFLHIQTDRIAELMAAADLAVGGGGVATWERCALGLPALVWAQAENQREVIHAAAEIGALYAPTAETVETARQLSMHLGALLASPSLCRHVGETALSLCDGNGVQRVADRLAPVSVVLRRATIDDCDNVYLWRNHPETRRFSIDAEPITYSEHHSWFDRSLCNPHRILLIAEKQSQPVGVLRYDLDAEVATVSLYLIPGLSGKGLGSAMIESGESWLRKTHPEIAKLRAVVLEANYPSKNLFQKCGFSRHHIVLEKSLQ